MKTIFKVLAGITLLCFISCTEASNDKVKNSISIKKKDVTEKVSASVIESIPSDYSVSVECVGIPSNQLDLLAINVSSDGVKMWPMISRVRTDGESGNDPIPFRYISDSAHYDTISLSSVYAFDKKAALAARINLGYNGSECMYMGFSSALDNVSNFNVDYIYTTAGAIDIYGTDSLGNKFYYNGGCESPNVPAEFVNYPLFTSTENSEHMCVVGHINVVFTPHVTNPCILSAMGFSASDPVTVFNAGGNTEAELSKVCADLNLHIFGDLIYVLPIGNTESLNSDKQLPVSIGSFVNTESALSLTVDLSKVIKGIFHRTADPSKIAIFTESYDYNNSRFNDGQIPSKIIPDGSDVPLGLSLTINSDVIVK